MYIHLKQVRALLHAVVLTPIRVWGLALYSLSAVTSWAVYQVFLGGAFIGYPKSFLQNSGSELSFIFDQLEIPFYNETILRSVR